MSAQTDWETEADRDAERTRLERLQYEQHVLAQLNTELRQAFGNVEPDDSEAGATER
jgi:hypothetical protein